MRQRGQGDPGRPFGKLRNPFPKHSPEPAQSGTPSPGAHMRKFLDKGKPKDDQESPGRPREAEGSDFSKIINQVSDNNIATVWQISHNLGGRIFKKWRRILASS